MIYLQNMFQVITNLTKVQTIVIEIPDVYSTHFFSSGNYKELED